jgi:hypothetical protein
MKDFRGRELEVIAGEGFVRMRGNLQGGMGKIKKINFCLSANNLSLFFRSIFVRLLLN